MSGCLGNQQQEIQDTDGDGVIDSKDYAPRDPDVQRKSDIERSAGATEASSTATTSPTPTATETRTSTPTSQPTFACDDSDYLDVEIERVERIEDNFGNIEYVPVTSITNTADKGVVSHLTIVITFYNENDDPIYSLQNEEPDSVAYDFDIPPGSTRLTNDVDIDADVYSDALESAIKEGRYEVTISDLECGGY
jgi:hypothetical protein